MQHIKLTMKQERFCIAYLKNGNATESYAMSFNASKMKRKTINERASVLLALDKIQTRLKELMAPTIKKLNVSTTKTLNRLMQGQEFDVRKLYNEDGCLKKPHELDDDTAKAIVGVKYDSEGNIEYKIIDVKGCSELVGRHLKLFGSDAAETSRPIVVMPTIKLGKTEISFDIGTEPDNS